LPGVSAVGLQPAVKASKPTDIKNNLTARRATNLNILGLFAIEYGRKQLLVL
jgi:hypothetical protein